MEIESQPKSKKTTESGQPVQRKPDGILIDDDPLVRSTWEMVAKQHQKEILVFSSPEEFKKFLKGIAQEVPLFIDSNLKGGVKGEVVAKDFFETGFKSIYLVTGYDSSRFGYLPWIKGILDKTPPGWLLGAEVES